MAVLALMPTPAATRDRRAGQFLGASPDPASAPRRRCGVQAQRPGVTSWPVADDARFWRRARSSPGLGGTELACKADGVRPRTAVQPAAGRFLSADFARRITRNRIFTPVLSAAGRGGRRQSALGLA